MKVYIVTIVDKDGDNHVVEVFSDEKKSVEYFQEMGKLYPSEDCWRCSWSPREINVEALNISGNKNHYNKIDDPVWVSKWNTKGYVPLEDTELGIMSDIDYFKEKYEKAQKRNDGSTEKFKKQFELLVSSMSIYSDENKG